MWPVHAAVLITQRIATLPHEAQSLCMLWIACQIPKLLGVGSQIVKELKNRLLLEVSSIDPTVVSYPFPVGKANQSLSLKWPIVMLMGEASVPAMFLIILVAV